LRVVSAVAVALRRVHALEVRMSRLRAEQVVALAAVADAGVVDSGYADGEVPVDADGWQMPGARGLGGFVADDLAAWMRWTTYRADQALAEACRLREALPVTLGLLAQGRIDYPRAQVVVRAVQVLDDEQAQVVDAAVAPVIGSLSTGALRPVVDREVLAADPGAAARRHRRAVAGRYLACRPGGDGIATLSAVGPATEILARHAQLRALARRARAAPGETRTQSAIAFDLLIDSTDTDTSGASDDVGTSGVSGDVSGTRGCAGVSGTSTSGDVNVTIGSGRDADAGPGATGGDGARSEGGDGDRGGSRGRRGRARVPALVNVTIALPTLLGLDDNPAELTGYGPIPAQIARDLATSPDSTLRRLVTDPLTGALLGTDGHPHPALSTNPLNALNPLPATTPPPGARSTPPAPTGCASPTGSVSVSPTGSVSPGADAIRATDPSCADPGRADPGRADPGRADPSPADSSPADSSTGQSPAPATATPAPPAPQCEVAAAGGGSYRPPAWMARHVTARDTRCTAPGCRQPAHRCDIDHIRPWPTGPTCPCNLHPLCRRHHRMKQAPGWSVRRDPDGTTTWTTPTGLATTTDAEPVLPRPLSPPHTAPPKPPDVDDDPDFDDRRRAQPIQRLTPAPPPTPALPAEQDPDTGDPPY